MDGDRVRLDKWLWAARFFKTRGLASDAIKGGRVHVGGARAKPATQVRLDDLVDVTIGESRRSVVVRGLSDRRGPAREAVGLYEETAESIAVRERRAEQRRLAPTPGAELGPRPTKRDRRRVDAARGGRRPR